MIKVFHIQRDGTYLHVADVKVPPRAVSWVTGEMLEWAWEQTNSIDQEWRLNLHVEMQTEGQHRSSMIGDLFVTEDGTVYRAETMVFSQASQSIEEILEDAEDQRDARLARREGVEQGTIPWEDVKKELGL